MKIRDATGTGRGARVDEYNHLETNSINIDRASFISKEKGAAFVFNMPGRTVTTTEGVMFYLKNTSESQDLYVSQLLISYNGGSTNHNRAAEVTFDVGSISASANYTASAGSNINGNSASNAAADFFYWDEGSTGITTSGQAASVTTLIVGQGFYNLDARGSLIIPPNVSFIIKCHAEEAGNFAAMVNAYYE